MMMQKIFLFFSKDSYFYIKVFLLLFLFTVLIKTIVYVNMLNVTSNIKIISRVFLDNNNKIFVVNILDRQLILGITPNSMTILRISSLSKNLKIKFRWYNYMIFFLFNNFSFYNFFFRFIVFIFFLFFSVNAYSLEYSGLANHILMNNIQNWSFPLQISVLIAFLTFLSTFILVATSFTRIIIVLSLLRNALGLPSLPPNQVLISISLLLTFFIMNPTIHRIYQEAYLPLCDNIIKFDSALINGIKPIYDFMKHQTCYSDIAMFSNLSHSKYVSTTDVVPMKVLLPAFITSELKTAFKIGFTIFLPFLIIDIIVASILMSLGMLMVSPSSISLPIKLILFVLVDGWQLLFSSLVKSFY